MILEGREGAHDVEECGGGTFDTASVVRPRRTARTCKRLFNVLESAPYYFCDFRRAGDGGGDLTVTGSGGGDGVMRRDDV
jgi:hypothetical protein